MPDAADRLYALVRHSAYALAANPAYDEALEPCAVDRSQAVRVRAAGGALYATRAEAEAAIPGAVGYFASLRLSGAELFVHASRQG